METSGNLSKFWYVYLLNSIFEKYLVPECSRELSKVQRDVKVFEKLFMNYGYNLFIYFSFVQKAFQAIVYFSQ